MQYELKKIEYIGNPREKNATAYTQSVHITTGIVGQTYNGFVNMDLLPVDFPATGIDADGIKNLIISAATAFVVTKYPNI